MGGGRQISGIGGSFDFVARLASERGRVIIALPSEAGGGRFSRIVPTLEAGAPVNIPRHHVQTVVTEHASHTSTADRCGGARKP